MNYRYALLTILIALILATGLSACQKISLSGNSKTPPPGNQTPAIMPMPGTNQNPSPASPGGATQAPDGSGPPPLADEWEIDFTVPNGDAQISNVVFSQQGKVLVGDGTDQSGRPWQIQDGVVNGTNVTFSKIYTDREQPPINYIGQLKFESSPEFTGWLMEGTYTAANGSVSGKWVSNPTGGGGQAPAEDPGAPAAPGQPQVAGTPTPPTQPVPDHIGDDKPKDVSGKYYVSYQYNFKTIKGHMWLEHDGNKLGGHGIDTSTSEAYTITAGKYNYPDISFTRSYEKGKNVKVARKVLFRAKISSDGHLIGMKGETQFGGRWEAKLARLR